MQVVEDPNFKALNKASDGKYGHYVLNSDTRLFVKYTTGSGPEFKFNLSPDDLDSIRADEDKGHAVFLVLVCGEESICPVPASELWNVVDRTTTAPKQVWVTWPNGGSMRFGCGSHELTKTIPHNSFPKQVLS